MKKGLAAVKSFFMRDERAFMALMSLAFFLLLCFVHIGGDDAGSMRYEGGTFYNYLQLTKAYFFSWSSRIFVNTVMFVFTDGRQLLWAVCMGISMYMLLRALYVLSDAGKGLHSSRIRMIFIAAMVLVYPYKDITTAGWIATTTTYFMPTAAGFYSLIPIKKSLDGASCHWWEYLLYAGALLFGANNEQMMIVILGSYAAAVLYSVIRKKVHLFWIVQLLLSCASCALVLLCPGNWQRKSVEATYHFPTWQMYNRIDQADLGYSLTMRWLLFASNLFTIALCLLLAFIIWKKYENTAVRLMAGVPAMCTILFGPLKSITTMSFPAVADLSDAYRYQGLVTVGNRGDFGAFITYAIWAVLIILISVELILASEKIWTVAASFVLLGTGLASRIAIGFSPTVHVSGMRTCAVMSFCVIAVTCLVFSGSVEKGILKGKALEVIGWISRFTMVCAGINLALLVGGTVW